VRRGDAAQANQAQRWLKQHQPPHVECVDPVLEQTAENSKHLSADEA
jgi:hypothetical protein